MVDRPTLDAYDAHAAQYAQDWLDQAAPDDMYALLEQHFLPGPTADVGCGPGAIRRGLRRAASTCAATTRAPRCSTRRDAAIRISPSSWPRCRRPACRPARFATYCAKRSSSSRTGGGGGGRATAELLMPGGTLYMSWRVAGNGALRDERGRSTRRSIPRGCARRSAPARSDRRARGRQRLVRQARAPADHARLPRRMSATRRHLIRG